MARRLLAIALAVAALAIAWNLELAPGAGQAEAQQFIPYHHGYGFYVHPGPSVLGAQLYPCPRPTPPLVGHTYITYQPLAPHEFMSRHHRCYRIQNADGSVTKVRSCWR
jgi:hypothetical protein